MADDTPTNDKPQPRGYPKCEPYPKREPYFAQRYIRLLFKTCMPNDIGQDAVILCTCIVTVEDAKRYRGPVSFHNGQLLPILGFGKWERLDAARRVAVSSGWLYYFAPRQGTREPGLYWATIPADVGELSDSPIDEQHDPMTAAYHRGYQDGKAGLPPQLYPVAGDSHGQLPPGTGYSQGYSQGYSEGEHISILSPNPISCSEPSSTKTAEPASPAPGFEPFPCAKRGETWKLPAAKLLEWSETYPHLDTPAELRKAWQWCVENPTKRKTAGGMPRFLNTWLARAQDSGRGTRPTDAKPAESAYKTLKPI
ncbi:MAG: hypothetical protein NTY19_18425 [Planctomycetota bacterium]|nr:hypothetical protein [Planctomycetota bacterium]